MSYQTASRDEFLSYCAFMLKRGLSRVVTFALYEKENRYQVGYHFRRMGEDLSGWSVLKSDYFNGGFHPVYIRSEQKKLIEENAAYIRRIRAGEFKQAEVKPSKKRKGALFND